MKKTCWAYPGIQKSTFTYKSFTETIAKNKN